MVQCRACDVALPDTSRFCTSCGTAVDVSSSPTHTAPSPAVRTPDPVRSPRPSSGGAGGVPSGAAGQGGFCPGASLAGRYRIVGLLGRGGMGEVYRADDLKLGQPVALKFLPQGLEQDADRLERLYVEVRMARQIAHPAVCRV